MVVLGIDWGTTNSCVSYYNSDCGKFLVIPNEQGELVSPSIVYCGETEVICGSIALNIPGHLSNLKRLVGKDSSVIPLIIHYLDYLKEYALKFIGVDGVDGVDGVGVVITVPVYYNDNQREIIKKCFEECKMNVIRIINEPTAAALAYAYANANSELKDEFVLVFDCGGGTTDLSLLYLEHSTQVYEVKNVIGDNFLGGEDITQSIVDYILQKLKIECKGEKIKRSCDKVKCDLSFKDNATFTFELGERYYSRTISRIQFLDITREFFKKIKDLIMSLLNDLNPQIYKALKKVIFVGGTTRIPYFRDIFKEILGNDVIIHSELDPDCTVSLGAAVQGALIEDVFIGDFSDTLLLDIIPLSIGIETVGGIMTPIISRNSILPISRTQDFTTTDDNVEIAIYQGERKFVQDNFLLAKFNFECKESDVISVTFDISLDGIITASAKIKGREQSITITKNETCRNIEIEQHLLDAEMSKIMDTEKANQVVRKNDLYDTFKMLLGVFHEHSAGSQSDYIKNELNKLFNETFYIIQDFESYSSAQLREFKKVFEETWHQLVFDGSTGFDGSDIVN